MKALNDKLRIYDALSTPKSFGIGPSRFLHERSIVGMALLYQGTSGFVWDLAPVIGLSRDSSCSTENKIYTLPPSQSVSS